MNGPEEMEPKETLSSGSTSELGAFNVSTAVQKMDIQGLGNTKMLEK